MILKEWAEKIPDSLPTFYFKNGQLPTFINNLAVFILINNLILTDFESVSVHLPTFCPLLKTKVGTKNPLFMRVSGLLPTFPLFFFIKCEKKN